MAAQMLLQTGDNIITISENCGFSSNSYFGKVFHESMGCTPMEYRRGKKNAWFYNALSVICYNFEKEDSDRMVN